jgi:hypothetical protein
MALRPILLIALAVFLFPSIARPDDTPSLPSRKASVVLPLLKAFTAKEGYTRIVQILGKEDMDTGNAINDCTYLLDDGSGIRVRANGDQVLSIFRQVPKIIDIQVIYALDKTWEH